MGRTYSHQVSQERTPEKECCGCRSWSWLLYLLVLLALALSVLNFWMSLYRHEEIRHNIEDVRSDLEDVSESLNSTIEALRLMQIDNEKLRTYAVSEIESILMDMKSLKKSPHHHQRPRIVTSENDDEESKEMSLIKEVKSTHGKMIDELVRKVLGYDSINAATLEAVNRLQKGFSVVEDEAKSNKQSMLTLQQLNEKIKDESVTQRDDFTRLNVTIHEVRTVVDRISTGLDVETLRTKTVESQVSSLREMVTGIEDDLIVRDANANRKVERIEQRLDDLERSEMDIKSDIRRLNGTAASLNSLPQGPTALALNDRQMDLDELRGRLSNLETSMTPLTSFETSEQWKNLNDTLRAHHNQVEQMLESFDRRLVDSKVVDKNIDEKIDKLDASVKYFAQNLMKMRTIPTDLKTLENRINLLQSTILNPES